MNKRDDLLSKIEDATFQARHKESTSGMTPTTEWYREKWEARDYEAIVERARLSPEDPVSCAYESMALRALGRGDESTMSVLRGLKFVDEKDSQMRSLLYNHLGIRILTVYKDDALAETVFRRAWEVFPKGIDGGWNSPVNVCEVLLERARAGRADMTAALAAVDDLLGTLLDSFGGDWREDVRFVNYMCRQIGLEEYRESSYWERRFGSISPLGK
jgi:hypothetical protein